MAATATKDTPVDPADQMIDKLAAAFTRANEAHDKKHTKTTAADYKQVSPFRPMGFMSPEGAALGFRRSFELNGQIEYQAIHNGAKIRLDLLHPTEIAAWNKLADSLKKVGDKRTARNGKWYATVLPSGDVLVVTPCQTEDDRAEVNAVPNIKILLQELMEGFEAVNPESLQEQLDALKAKVAAFEAQK